MSRTVMVLGGADGAIPTLRAASAMGISTICVDRRADAPGMSHCDEFWNISTLDVDGIAGAMQSRRDIAAVLSPASDVNLPTQYALSERLGLSSDLSRQALQASVDKAYFRHACDDLGLPGPRYVQADGRTVAEQVADLRYPVIVKPTDSSGGRGVRLVTAPDQLSQAADDAATLSRSGTVIVEEFLQGEHYTAEALVEGHVAQLLAVGHRMLTDLPFFVTKQHSMPCDDGFSERVGSMLTQICQALDYARGPINMDLLVTPTQRIVPIEMGARLGGNGSAEMLGHVHGVDAIEGALTMAMGRPLVLRHRKPRHVVFRALEAEREGKLTALCGLDYVRTLPEVLDVVVAAQPGDHVGRYEVAGSKVGYVIVGGDDESSVRSALDRVMHALEVEVYCDDLERL